MADLVSGARVTAANVAEIFNTTLTTAQLNQWINIAHEVIEANLLGQGLTAKTLIHIELMLSSHFAAMDDPRMKSENIGGDWSFTVQGQTGYGLDATFYGQQVKILDTSGILDKMGETSKNASVTILKDVV